MKRIFRVMVLIICIPLLGTMLVKPDNGTEESAKKDTSVIDERFEVLVDEDIGRFYYSPDNFTELVMYRVIPEDIAFSSSEDYIADTDAVYDPEQEYLKALSIICRSNIVYVWETEQCPDILEYGQMQLEAADFYKIYKNAVYDSGKAVKLKEIHKAAEATRGAVITKENRVIAAPFFTTSSSDMLVGEAGDGAGFSLNYAYELAEQGMDFYEILKYFFDDIKVNIYE